MMINKIRQYLMLSREPAHKDVVWVVAEQVRLATLLCTVQVATLSLLGSSFRTVLYYFVQVKRYNVINEFRLQVTSASCWNIALHFNKKLA